MIFAAEIFVSLLEASIGLMSSFVSSSSPSWRFTHSTAQTIYGGSEGGDGQGPQTHKLEPYLNPRSVKTRLLEKILYMKRHDSEMHMSKLLSKNHHILIEASVLYIPIKTPGFLNS